jgi:hypothetical protein
LDSSASQSISQLVHCKRCSATSPWSPSFSSSSRGFPQPRRQHGHVFKHRNKTTVHRT